ncbi:MAG: cytochrome c [Bacteroidia bacterium]|nr:cytochrome c [Bacteroidia bacterium]
MNSLKSKDMNYKHIKRIILPALAILVLVSGCGRDKRSVGIEYAPQMYHSIPLEPFTQVAGKYSPFKDSLTNAQLPPEGTVAHNAMVEFANLEYVGGPTNNEERIQAGKELTNPFEATPEVLEEGKVLYTRFCVVCHGATGMADGTVPATGKYPPPTIFNKKTAAELPQGEIFYNMTYGKNAMWSYASQISVENRWKVARYVETMLKKADAPAAAPVADEGDAVDAAADAVNGEGNPG